MAADLTIQGGPFKGKPQQWFTRPEVERLLAAEQQRYDELFAAYTEACVDAAKAGVAPSSPDQPKDTK